VLTGRLGRLMVGVSAFEFGRPIRDDINLRVQQLLAELVPAGA
jgi:hypothetical protein